MTDFGEILDQCVADIQAGRGTPASCLAQYPEQAEQLTALLAAAVQLPALPSASLSIEKRQAIQAQLLRRAAELQHNRPRQRQSPHVRLIRRLLPAAAAFMLALSLAGWAVTTASA